MSPRALEGRTVVVTRAAEQAAPFVALLEAEGARVVQAPTIAIEPPASWEALDRALDAAATFTWAIFTSVNGVLMVDRRLAERGGSWSALRGARVAAIGPATASALAARGLAVDLTPEEYRAEGLVERLRGRLGAGDRVLLPRAARTRDVLVTALAATGAEVVEVAAYTTRRVESAAPSLRRALEAGAVDVVTFTSSSTARNFAELFTEAERRAWLAAVTVASIGPITAATAAEYGLTTHVMPREYTIPALARAIVEHFARPGTSPRGVGSGSGRRSE